MNKARLFKAPEQRTGIIRAPVVADQERVDPQGAMIGDPLEEVGRLVLCRGHDRDARTPMRSNNDAHSPGQAMPRRRIQDLDPVARTERQVHFEPTGPPTAIRSPDCVIRLRLDRRGRLAIDQNGDGRRRAIGVAGPPRDTALSINAFEETERIGRHGVAFRRDFSITVDRGFGSLGHLRMGPGLGSVRTRIEPSWPGLSFECKHSLPASPNRKQTQRPRPVGGGLLSVPAKG